MSYWVICDRCGFTHKDDELREEWTGLMVCDMCWEPRHPQEMIRPVRDNRPLPYTRPEPDGISVAPEFNDLGPHMDIPTGTFTENNRTALD